MITLIAIVGALGSGKSTVVSLLAEQLECPVIINESVYFIGITTTHDIIYESSSQIDHRLLIQQLKELKIGNTVLSPQSGFELQPKEIVLVEGIFILSNPELISLFDFIVYVDAPKDICLQRLISRDTKALNKPLDLILEEYRKQRCVYHTFIKPHKNKAHIVVDNGNTLVMLTQTITQVMNNNVFNNLHQKSKLNILASSKKQGILFVISGPSGVGKTSLIRNLTKKMDIKRVVTYTTRPLRVGEVNGTLFNQPEADYHFIDQDTFAVMSRDGLFMLEIKIHDHFYGATKGSFLEPLNRGEDLIVDLDSAHLPVLSAHVTKIVTIFIGPFWEDQLEAQLKTRGEKNLGIRLASGVSLMNSHPELTYDYLVLNQTMNLHHALGQLKVIIAAERLRFRAFSDNEQRAGLQNLI